MTSALILITLLAQSNPGNRAAELSRAWAALGQGDYARAQQAAGALLRANPADHEAATVAVTAAVQGQGPTAGLDQYESWLRSSRHEDVYLLEPVAVGVLSDIANGKDTGLAVAALARLATAAPDAARAAAAKHPASDPAFDSVRAALGDRQALGRLSSALSGESSRERLLALNNLSMIQTIPDGFSADAVAPLLADPAPPVKAAAIELLARVRGKAAADEIRPLLSDDDPFVQATAAVAMARLGDPVALDRINQMAQSPIGDTAAMAAAVLKERGTDVSEIAARIGADPNPLTRLSAASLLGADSVLGRAILTSAAADSNPVIRSRAAQLLPQAGTPELSLLRRLLRDANPEVRLNSASALIRLIRG